MPQLEVHLFPMQLFWLAVTFLVLYVLMAKIALPKVGAALDARAAKIDGDLAVATAARDQAKALIDAHERSIREANEQSRIQLRDAFQHVQTTIQQREAELSAEIGARSKAADQRIGEAKAAALGDLAVVAREAVSLATTKLLGETPADGDIAAAVEQALGGRRS